ncbi:amidohydrolase family-domain-containing protein [Xylaria palmicola]|nr:amidohydrolase family-domain-containing protein [Xylaria palmicola]
MALTSLLRSIGLGVFLVGRLVASVECNNTTSGIDPTASDTLGRLRFAQNMTADADLVVRNAKIFTAAEGPATHATGFAVKAGKFVAVTNNDADLDPFVGSTTQVHDLAGTAVVPGLFDTHIHHIGGGKTLLKEVKFSSTLPLDGVLAAVDAYARNLTNSSGWVTGGNWGSLLLSEISTPEALKRLDDVSHGHPVLLSDDSHHDIWANTLALQAAGLSTDNATGVLIEGAANPVFAAQAAAEPDTLEDLKSYARAAWDLLHSYGVTAIQDAAVSEPQLDAMVSLDEDNGLKGWVSSCLVMSGAGINQTGYDQHARQVGRDRVRTDFTKLVLDGVPPTQTAAFLEAYLPTKEHGCDYHGVLYNTTGELVETLRLYRSQGRGTKIHCTGDWAVQVALDAFEVMRAEGSTQTYHVAHGQFVTPEDRRRMKLLEVVAEVSPFIWYPGIIPSAIATVLPADFASQIQPNRALLDLGVLVAGGSDWSVSAVPNPWEGIGGLVTRQDPTGLFPGTLWAEQAVSVEEALRIFSINGAKAARLDDVVGSIEVGKAANFIFIDRDPFSVKATDIGNTTVLQTYVAGEVVYSRS